MQENKLAFISSKANILIKKAMRLGKDSSFRHLEQAALIYGKHLLIEAHHHKLISEIFILKDKLDHYTDILTNYNPKQIHILDNRLMKKINLLSSAIEAAAIIRMKSKPKLNEVYHQDCLILEQIQDPGNLGTILRAAAASGMCNIIVSNQSVDVYNPKVLRASQGIQFNLNIFTNIELMQFLVKYKGQILAMTPTASFSLYKQDLTVPTAIVLGNEGNGLSQQILNVVSKQVSIPMANNSESLNLAMAATIGLFEILRQRLEKRC